jgi:hypothetical protein
MSITHETKHILFVDPKTKDILTAFFISLQQYRILFQNQRHIKILNKKIKSDVCCAFAKAHTNKLLCCSNIQVLQSFTDGCRQSAKFMLPKRDLSNQKAESANRSCAAEAAHRQ